VYISEIYASGFRCFHPTAPLQSLPRFQALALKLAPFVPRLNDPLSGLLGTSH
jgi:hypothetical protein